MDDLHVDSQLAPLIVDDQDANGAAARLEGGLETAPEAGLLEYGQGLLDVTGLSHGDHSSVLHVQDAVLLENGTEHGLHDDARGRVGDRTALLVQLLGEEINAEVAVLASGCGGADANDLARTSLQHENVPEADVVAGNGDSVGHVLGTVSCVSMPRRGAGAGGGIIVVVTHLGFLSAGRVLAYVYVVLGESDARGLVG